MPIHRAGLGKLKWSLHGLVSACRMEYGLASLLATSKLSSWYSNMESTLVRLQRGQEVLFILRDTLMIKGFGKGYL